VNFQYTETNSDSRVKDMLLALVGYNLPENCPKPPDDKYTMRYWSLLLVYVKKIVWRKHFIEMIQKQNKFTWLCCCVLIFCENQFWKPITNFCCNQKQPKNLDVFTEKIYFMIYLKSNAIRNILSNIKFHKTLIQRFFGCGKF